MQKKKKIENLNNSTATRNGADSSLSGAHTGTGKGTKKSKVSRKELEKLSRKPKTAKEEKVSLSEEGFLEIAKELKPQKEDIFDAGKIEFGEDKVLKEEADESPVDTPIDENASDIARLAELALQDEKRVEEQEAEAEKERIEKEEQAKVLKEEQERLAEEQEEIDREAADDTPKSDRVPPKEVPSPETITKKDEDLFDYDSKNKILENVIKSAVLEDEDLDRLSKLLGNGNSVHTLRLSRHETGSFDMAWVKAVEDAIPAIDEILKNPRINTKVVTDIVPVELAKKTGSESVKHLASHTQYVKDIDENGNVIPSKILNIGSDDEYITYENRFVATVIRRLVLFIEKRYDFIVKYSELKDYDILYIKNHSDVNGLAVDVESKVVVSRPSGKGAADGEDNASLMKRINLMRRYAKFFYSSDFMKRFKNEKNVRAPIMQTNIIRKNPKYHKVYNLYRFMEMYRALGVEFTVKEDYYLPEQADLDTINNLTVANFLAARAKPSEKDKVSKVEVKNPEVLTTVDDDIFTFFPTGEYPEYVRVDEEYLRWKERNTKDLKEDPNELEKAYRGNDYLRKAKAEKERARREALKARREKERQEFLEEQERLKAEKEAERIRQEKLAKEREEAKALVELEAAREAVRQAAREEDEDLLLAIVTPVEITITGDTEIVAKTTYAQLESTVEFYIADPSLVWSSSNEEIATVDQTGYVSGWKEGDVVIRATSVEDPSCYTDYEMHVYPRPPITVSFPTIDKILVTKEATLTPVVRNADDLSVIWHSSNEAVATVIDGVVHAYSAGNVVITAFSSEDPTKSHSICIHPLDGIELSGESHSIVSRRTTLQLNAFSNVSADDMILFFSSDENIATVDQNGHVEGVSWDGGEVEIKVISTVDPTISNTYKVTVLPKPIVSVTLEGDSRVFLSRPNQLIGTVINAMVNDVTWTSSDESVATVVDGVVTGVSIGSATITCRSNEETDKFATLDIEVKEAIIIAEHKDSLIADLTMKLEAISNVSDDDTIIWVSSDESVATVDNNGIVTGVKEGDATISASSSKEPELFQEFTLHITPAIAVTLSGSNVALTTKTIATSVEVLNAEDYSVTYKSSDENIATVDENGVVTTLSAGVVMISATSVQDPTKNSEIEITIRDGIELSTPVVAIRAGKTTVWSAISNVAEDDVIVWSTDDESIATVDSNGTITGVSDGKATIYATSSTDDTLYATGVIEIRSDIAIEIDGPAKIIKSRTAKYEAILLNADNSAVIWSTSDDGIITIDENGVATALQVGDADIMVQSAEDSEKTSSIRISVKEGVELNYVETSLISNKTTLTLNAITNVSDDDTIVWTSSNDSIATVDNGVVTGIDKLGGDVVIRASSSNDPELYKEVNIHVEPMPIVGINIIGSNRAIPGKAIQLAAEVERADDPSVVWTTSDENIATVDENGLVTPIAVGKVLISATSVEQNDKCATFEVNVYEGIVFDTYKESLVVGKPEQFGAMSNVSEDDVVAYSSSDENIATVDEKGVVTGINAGTVTITASSKTDSTFFVDREISVKPDVSIEIVGQNNYVIGQKVQLTANVLHAIDTSATWSSSNEFVAKVDSEGLLTVLAAGTTVISARSVEDMRKLATLEITVIDGIAFLDDCDEVFIGKSVELSAKSNLENDSIIWSSSDEAIATIDENGLLTGTGLGEVTIKATSTTDENVYSERKIDVVPRAPIEVEVYGTDRLFVGKDSQFSVYVTNADDPSVTWGSSSEDVATVSSDGLVHGVSAGDVTILVTSIEDPTKSASLTLTISDGLTLEADEIEVIAKDDVVWSAISSVAPDDTVTWTSSDETIATVREGMITGVTEGVTTITATSNTDPAISISKEITVLPRPATILTIGELSSVVMDGNATIPFTIENAKDKTVRWTSSDESVIRVDDAGTLTGVAIGSAEITVTSVEDPTKSATTSVACIEKVIVTSEEDTFRVKETIALTGVSNLGDEDTLVWTTSDVNIATVSPNGEVLGIGEGEAIITATSTLDPTASASKTVTVLPKLNIIFTTSTPATNITAGKQFTISTHIENAKDESLTWTTTDEKVATVENGLVTGVSRGNATITASVNEDPDKTITVNVSVKGGIIIAPGVREVKVGQTLILSAKSTVGIGDKIVWETSDEEIAFMTGEVVCPVKPGVITVTATSSINSLVHSSVEVTVHEKTYTLKKTVVKSDRVLTLDDIKTNKQGRVVSTFKRETIVEELVEDDGITVVDGTKASSLKDEEAKDENK